MSPQVAEFVALLRRYPWCAACALIAVVSGGSAWWLDGDIDDLAEPYAERGKEYEEMLKLTKGGRTQREELEFVRETTRRLEDNLLVETNLAENNWYFYKYEEQTKAHLVELHQLNSPINDPSPLFRRVPYTLRVEGTYEQVANFVLALETGPRLARVTSFTLSRSAAAKDAGRGGGDVAADPGGLVVFDFTLEMLGKK
jgi:Tfp pilus assembly protein PilO